MISEKLSKIQTEIKAPKNLFNNFGKYKYRNAEGICEAVKPYLKENGCSLVLSDDVVQIGDRIYVKAIATLQDNDTGETVFVSAFARESAEKKGMDDSQITGTASSYARKYALNGLFLLDDTKDTDTDEYKTEVVARKEKAEQEEKEEAVSSQVIKATKVKVLTDKCIKEGVDGAKLCAIYKVNLLSELTEKQFSNINNHWDQVKERCK